MSQWDGKSKGTILGYRIFVGIIRQLGVRAAYLLLVFVAFYYFIFYPATFKAQFRYFRRRQQFSLLKSIIAVYWGYFVFGQTIIDKVAVLAGMRDRFTFDFDGIDVLKAMLKDGKGGILISGHVGNFEIAEKFFAEIDFDHQIHIVTVDQERSVIKDYLSSVATEKANVNFIYIKEDLSHIFEINDALSKNHLICFTGDRYFDEGKVMEQEFMGAFAKFPAGVFTLASRLDAPIAFVYVMKESNLHYHLYTRKSGPIKRRDAQAVLRAYAESMSSILQKYPYQWFNFFDFWKK